MAIYKKSFILGMILSFLLLVNVEAKVYSIEIVFSNSNIYLENFSLFDGEPPNKYSGYDYKLEVYDGQNDLVYFDLFNKPIISYEPDPSWFDEEGNQIYFPKLPEEENVSLSLYIPYFENAEKIIISKNETKLLEINIKDYVVCNKDGTCDKNETELSCPDDCKEENISSMINQTVEDMEKIKETKKIQPEEKTPYLFLTILSVAIILTILLIIFLVKKSRKTTSQVIS